MIFYKRNHFLAFDDSLTAKQSVTKYKTEDNNAEGNKSVSKKKHDCHADGNPKENETNQTFQENTSTAIVRFYALGEEKVVGKKKIRAKSKKKVYFFAILSYNQPKGLCPQSFRLFRVRSKCLNIKEGYYMDGNLTTSIGDVYIDYDVIAKYAGSAAVECFGIVGMAAVSMKDGLARLLRKESLSKGVTVKVKENKITIDMHVIVSYGISIAAVTANLCENVKYRVEELSGLAVEKVNVYVEGVRVID